ncbi:MAG: hypothetical protein V4667_00310 [Bacteroidota bacterium]
MSHEIFISNSKILEPIITRLVSECTLQLFEFANEKIKHDSCCIYLKTSKNHYLISAAHVFDFIKNRIGILLENEGLMSPGGEVYLSQNAFLSENERMNDKIDIGVLKLNNSIVTKLNSCYKKPLTFKNIEISSQNKNSRYIIYGFPTGNKFTKVLYGSKKINSNAFMYYTHELNNINYEKNGYSKKENILLYLDPENIATANSVNKSKIDDLRGLSGCGVWKICNEKTHYELKLIGIINFNKKGTNYVVATRIDFITEYLRLYIDENIEKSKFVSEEKINSVFFS